MSQVFTQKALETAEGLQQEKGTGQQFEVDDEKSRSHKRRDGMAWTARCI